MLYGMRWAGPAYQSRTDQRLVSVPVAEITATARRIRSTTLHERLAADGLPAELSDLAATFNEMMDALKSR